MNAIEAVGLVKTFGSGEKAVKAVARVDLAVPKGTVVGLLRQQDLLEYIAEAFPQEILNLPPRPHQTMEEQEGA